MSKKDSFKKYASKTGGWIKENPLKSSLIFFLAPADVFIGGTASLTIVAGGTIYGVGRAAHKDKYKSKPKR